MTKSNEHHKLSLKGSLASRIPGFVSRLAQVEMSNLVSDVIRLSSHGAIEAGTGTGKTFAYLVPALASGKKVVVSTGTKNLQDQLFYQDIPLVNHDFNRRVALLKGRGNYLCPRRLHNNLQQITSRTSQDTVKVLVEVKEWAVTTKTGDLTELLDPGEEAAVLPLVTSTRDNCLGRECDFFVGCPLYAAREKAMNADLVVVNHHLLLADIALKEDAASRLIPNAEIIIADEAHQLADTARQFFGDRISTAQLNELAADILNEQIVAGNDDPALVVLGRALTQAVHALVMVGLDSEENLDQLLSGQECIDCLESVDVALSGLINHLQQVSERTVGLKNCYSRAMKLADLFALLTESVAADNDYAHWIDRQARSFSIYLSPVDVAEELKPVFAEKPRSWIFVSATLTVNNSFDHFKQSIGLSEFQEGQFESPFDYTQQVKGFIPEGLPGTGGDRHTLALLQQVLPVIRANGGRTFFLFTSHRALKLASELMQREYDIVYLMQGSLPKKRLLEKFRELPRCVLLATQSFWEGVDVRGADLRCLIIDKLPFASPDNPMVQAQLKAIERRGDNGFNSYSLPEAAISLKQGFGRLIRQESDRGLFILGDSRIVTRGYGKILLRSLPEMEWIRDKKDVLTYMRNLGPLDEHK